MPMTWNAQADAQLLFAIIQVYDVKVSGAKLNEVASLMGKDCTAKALSHRLAKIRQSVKGDLTDGAAQESTAGSKKTANANSGAKKGPAKKAAGRTRSSGDDEMVDGAALTPPPSSGPKRGQGKKRKHSDSDGDDAGALDGDKKVKVESGADDEDGLGQAADFEENMDDMDGDDILA